jgi:hypothetical protein
MVGRAQVLTIVLQKGVTSGMIAEVVGWILVHVLSYNSSWTYKNPAQQHKMSELCIRVLRRGLQVTSPHHSPTTTQQKPKPYFPPSLLGLIWAETYLWLAFCDQLR